MNGKIFIVKEALIIIMKIREQHPNEGITIHTTRDISTGRGRAV